MGGSPCAFDSSEDPRLDTLLKTSLSSIPPREIFPSSKLTGWSQAKADPGREQLLLAVAYGDSSVHLLHPGLWVLGGSVLVSEELFFLRKSAHVEGGLFCPAVVEPVCFSLAPSLDLRPA